MLNILNLDKINIALVFVILAYLLLAILIYFKGQNRRVAYSYITVIFAVIFWTLGMILFRLSLAESSLFWCRVLYVAATFTASSFFIFSYVFPRGELPSWKKISLAIALNLVIIILVLTPDIIIRGVNLRVGQEKEIVWGRWYFLYVLYISGFFASGLTVLLNKYRKEKEATTRLQLKYVFWGYFLGSNLAMLTNLLMVWWGDFRLNWAGQILSAFMVGFTVYAIVAHRLMDIKIVLRRSTVYLASVLTVAVPAGLILYFADRFYPGATVATSLAVLILGVSLFPAIRNYFYRLANKYFFSSLYDSSEVTRSLTDKLRSTLEARKIYDYIAGTLKGAFHSRAVGILTYDEKKNEYIIQYNEGFDIDHQKIFPTDRWLREKFAKQGQILVVEEIEKETGGASASAVELLKRLGVEILAPLNVKDKTIGLIVLGGKESRDMYNSEDLRVLETTCGQAAISIENALLYEESREFAITLKQEVAKATAELRVANLELQKLDKAKSDFISIASHQLRTPLSAIKGFISMILEGSYGRITKVVRDKLEKTYESTERLIRLVNDLLDLSHMEGGKMEFNFIKVDLAAMAQSVVEELRGQADKKKLELKLERPQKELWVRADEQKLRQVVMNLIDNAVKYTDKGSVRVSLRELSSPGEKDGQVQVAVRDTGMGLRPDEIANLFQKFVRGPEASRYHTEGAGIGLYVSKLLIGEHQGQIWVESEGEGKGSTFFIKLPEWKD